MSECTLRPVMVDVEQVQKRIGAYTVKLWSGFIILKLIGFTFSSHASTRGRCCLEQLESILSVARATIEFAYVLDAWIFFRAFL